MGGWHSVVWFLLLQHPNDALRMPTAGEYRTVTSFNLRRTKLASNRDRWRSEGAIASSSSLSVAQSPPNSLIRESGRHDGNASSMLNRRDVFHALAHLGGCVAGAVGVSAYQDFDCSALKPQTATLRSSRWGAATAGMGRGTEIDSSLTNSPPAYNAVMLHHRRNTVPRWKEDSVEAMSSVTSADAMQTAATTQDEVTSAVKTIYSALDEVRSLGSMAQEYDWDGMKSLLRSPRLTHQLDQACSVLRGAATFLSSQDRAEIGFHWGSCAWRHCGAQADAQESLAELYNLVGMLEPFECLFCLDIVERSLRDILAVVPSQYHPARQSLKPYEPYVSQASLMETEVNDDKMDYGAIDRDFLRVLGELRSNVHDAP